MHGAYRQQHDALPEAPSSRPSDNTSTQLRACRVRLRVGPEPYVTPKDTFGRYRVYMGTPQSIPDSGNELDSMSNVPEVADAAADPSIHVPTSSATAVYPCPNISSFLLQDWHWNGGAQKSQASRASLINDVLLDPRFSTEDLKGINWRQLDDNLRTSTSNSNGPAWSVHSVNVSIPPRGAKDAQTRQSDTSAGNFPVEMHSRKLTDIIRDTFEHNDPRFMHYEPYESHCQAPGSSSSQRLYSEGYESPRMIDHHHEIQKIKLDEPCDLPRCAAEVMVFSDALQLGLFGHAKAWPILISFANISKYERCRPNSKAWQELAYLPSVSKHTYLTHLISKVYPCQLPHNIQDRIRELGDGKAIPKPLLTHLRRELIHEVWNQLLDDGFLHAWRNGMVIRCADGITRRVFPRIFSYSADYPEK